MNNKIKSIKTLKGITIAVIIFLLIDCIATGFAIDFFLIRMIAKNDINVENKEAVMQEYNVIYGNEGLSNFIYTFWGDKKMIKTFPNLKTIDKDGNIIYMDSLLDIQPYYMQIYDKSKLTNKEFIQQITDNK